MAVIKYNSASDMKCFKREGTMGYGHLVIMGKPVDETDIEGFASYEDLAAWRAEIWPAFDAAYLGVSMKDGPQTHADLFGREFVKRLESELDRLKALDELKKPLVVQGESYRVLKIIDVLWSGWECDGVAWVVETPTGNRLVMTNHGSHFFAEASALQARINSYRIAQEASEEALALLAGPAAE